MKKTYEQALSELKQGEMLYTYALYTDGAFDNDTQVGSTTSMKL